MTLKFNSPGKKTVREIWNTPLLKYIHDKYQIKYHYFGLPGKDLTDIRLWEDMIDEITAFEIRDDSQDGRSSINELRKNIIQFEKPHETFFGSIEEVITLGVDWDGNKYEQNKLITLYNLDFCDEISSKIETRQRGEQLLRFEAIRKILSDQKKCYNESECPCFFIILITIRNQIYSNKIYRYLMDSPFQETIKYVNYCLKTHKIPKNEILMGSHSWTLKAFLYDILKSYCCNPNIYMLFFPLVKYQGTPKSKKVPSPMLNLMLFCKFGATHKPIPSSYPNPYLKDACSIRANDDGTLSWEVEPGEIIPSGKVITSDQWFQNFEHLFFPEEEIKLKAISL